MAKQDDSSRKQQVGPDRIGPSTQENNPPDARPNHYKRVGLKENQEGLGPVHEPPGKSTEVSPDDATHHQTEGPGGKGF